MHVVRLPSSSGGSIHRPSPHRRSISFICYLNEPGWTASDGGQLRLHGDGSESAESTPVQDVLPECGSLVLFDSKRVWHEVLPTRRERACIVGWFHVACA
jgi:SM-20-related protein